MKTSWDKVAKWYDEHLKEEGTYHQTVVLPGVLRLLALKQHEAILDVACGQGQLVGKLRQAGAKVMGIDTSKELITLAKKHVPGNVTLNIDDAKIMKTVAAGSQDAASIVLALQNIDDLNPVFKQLSRVLVKGGRAVFVITHPCFRIPRQSGWGFDEGRKLQYRRIDSYLTPQKIPIITHPGRGGSPVTWTFHRSLSDYFSAIVANGFEVNCLEEWTSDKASDSGPRAKAENRSRSEIPLFMAVRIIKN
ncbi:MAG: class I SAM-dependent methyltransferase [bacterium]